MQVPLFSSKKEVAITACVLAVFFALSLLYQYSLYLKLKRYSLHVEHMQIEHAYMKQNDQGKKYQVLKLKNPNLHFYTVLWEAQELRRSDRIKVGFYTKNISFLDFLQGFFAPLKFIQLTQKANENFLEDYFLDQHDNTKAKEIYGAVFFAEPLSKASRDKVATWGIAHLFAISGLHLALLSAVAFFMFKPMYRFFQNRYFPYRNALFDVSILVFILLGSYAVFIGLPPSVLRSFTMMAVGFFLFHKGLEVLNFTNLWLTVSLILIIFPKLLFSLGFWFSVAGVFYIFLYLMHFNSKSKIKVLLGLNFWVFALMLPIVHHFFDLFSMQQLFSPFISIAFGLFYPLALALHVIGYGSIFDGVLQAFLDYEIAIIPLHVPLWYFVIFIVFSLLAVQLRKLALVLPLFSIGTFLI